jgi:hypothetical protein
MKQEVSEISNLLQSIEDHLNQYRGIIREEEFFQANFEERFIKELLDLEAEVVTIRDISKIKKQVMNVQRIMYSLNI